MLAKLIMDCAWSWTSKTRTSAAWVACDTLDSASMIVLPTACLASSLVCWTWDSAATTTLWDSDWTLATSLEAWEITCSASDLTLFTSWEACAITIGSAVITFNCWFKTLVWETLTLGPGCEFELIDRSVLDDVSIWGTGVDSACIWLSGEMCIEATTPPWLAGTTAIFFTSHPSVAIEQALQRIKEFNQEVSHTLRLFTERFTPDLHVASMNLFAALLNHFLVVVNNCTRQFKIPRKRFDGSQLPGHTTTLSSYKDACDQFACPQILDIVASIDDVLKISAWCLNMSHHTNQQTVLAPPLPLGYIFDFFQESDWVPRKRCVPRTFCRWSVKNLMPIKKENKPRKCWIFLRMIGFVR